MSSGRKPGVTVTAVVASGADACFCGGDIGGDVYRLAGVGRYLPVLGFAGNRVGRIYRRTFPDEKVSEEQFIKFIKL